MSLHSRPGTRGRHLKSTYTFTHRRQTTHRDRTNIITISLVDETKR